MKRLYAILLFFACIVSISANPVITNGMLTAWTDASGRIIIPASVTSIKDSVFSNNTNITSVTIPNSTSAIGKLAFSGCANLSEIIIGDSTNTGAKNSILIQSNTFSGCTGVTKLSLYIPVTTYFYPFRYLTSLTSLTIGNSVTTVEYNAFTNLPNLNQVTLGIAGITPAYITINSGTFKNCPGLTTLNLNCNLQTGNAYSGDISLFSTISTLSIGEKVDSIAACSFKGCTKLSNVTLPRAIKSIGASAFNGCTSLKSVSIGSSVAKIGSDAFTECSALLSLNVDNTNTTFSSIDGVLLSKDQRTFLFYPAGRTGSYTIPSTVNRIATNAFYACNGLPSVVIPQAITTIQSAAFTNCTGLNELTIGNADSISTVKINIAANAFNGCKAIARLSLNKAFSFSTYSSPFRNMTSLTTLLVGNGVASLTDDTFFGCSGLQTVRLGQPDYTKPDTITISEYTFSECANLASLELNRNMDVTGMYSPFKTITSLSVGHGVTAIDDGSFWSCTNLSSANLPSSVKQIGSSAFSGCAKLQSASFPGATELRNQAFYGCSSLPSVTIPRAIKKIESGLFEGCSSLTTVNLGDSITQINYNAFYKCGKLTSINLPNTLQSIATYAFSECSALPSITLPNQLKSIGTYAFSGCSALSAIQFPPAVTSLGEHAFENCKGLVSLAIPSTLRTIGDYAFSKCSNLNSLTIGDASSPGLSLSIGMYAFSGCTNVTTLTLNKNNTDSSLRSAFMDLSGLTTVNFSKCVSRINTFSFYGCSKIKTLDIPNSVTTIGEAAFHGCTSLTNVKLPVSLENIPNGLFYGCSNLTSIYIPSTVKIIESYAFYDCTSLTTLSLPKSVMSVGAIALGNCTSLSSLTSANPIAPPVGRTGFYAVPVSTCKLYVPIGAKTSYKATDQWKDFANIIEQEIKDSVATDTTQTYPDPITGATKSVTITAGGLASALTTTELANINKLTISGSINAYDFMILRDSMPNLAVLDIKNSTIEAYTGTAGTAGNSITTYPANTIPNYAFYNPKTYVSKTGLASISLPPYIKGIGNQAFFGCQGLEGNFTLPQSIDSIGNGAFSRCTSLSGSLDCPSTLKYIGEQAFSNCLGLLSINFSPSVNYIGSAAFYRCERLMTVNDFPSAITTIKYSTFYQCNRLFSINIPQSVTTIENQAFGFTAFTSLTLPSSLQKIGDYAFADCYSLTTMDIPAGTTYIGNSVFINCYSLDSVSLPATMTYIGNSVFPNCSALKSLTAHPGVPVVPSTSMAIFSGLNTGNCTLYVPKGSLLAYQQADQWKSFSHIVEGDVSILWLDSYAMTFAGKGESKTNHLYTKPAWTATSDQSWLTISPDAGNGDTLLTLTVLPNPTVQSRTATVSLYINGTIQQYIKITQAAGEPIVSIINQPDSVSGTDSQTTSLNIISNSAWTVTSSMNWLTVSPATGTENATLTLASTPNPTVQSRTATLTFSANGITLKSIIVTQAPGHSTLSLSDNTATLKGKENSSGSVTVSSNTTWAATSSDTWLTLSTASGSGNGTLTFMATKNLSETSRTATITVAVPDCSPQSVTILQEPYLLATITKKWNNVLICNNSKKQFSSYQWYKNETPISGANRQYFEESGVLSGSYYVKVITTDNKEGQSNIYTSSSLSKTMRLYPNPVNQGQQPRLFIDLSTTDLAGSQLTINMLAGPLVYQNRTISTDMSLPPLRPGSYIVHIQLANGNSFSEKLIIY